MIGFIKHKDFWRREDDKNELLKTNKPCVLGNSIDSILQTIERNENNLGPEFEIVYIYDYGSRKGDEIYYHQRPKLKEMSFEKGLKALMRVEKTVDVPWDLQRKWESEIGDKKFWDFGIYVYGTDFLYHKEKAKKQKEVQEDYTKKFQKKRENWRRPHYIYHTDLYKLNDTLKWGFSGAVQRNLDSDNKHLKISTHDYNYYERTKLSLCKSSLGYIEAFNSVFKHHAYRKIGGFQKFKYLWKKQKPKTAKSIGVTQEFFDFMEKEVKARRPKGVNADGSYTDRIPAPMIPIRKTIYVKNNKV